MRNANHCLTAVIACLLIFCSYTPVSASAVVVLDQSIGPVSVVSQGRFYKIGWRVKLRNEAPEPQTCEITLYFLNRDDEVIGETSKTQTLQARESKTVKGSVQFRKSIAQQIATCDVSVEMK